jgi:hypothetical protein
VNAVFANRFKNEFGVDGEPLAIEVALKALRILSEGRAEKAWRGCESEHAQRLPC